MTTKSRSDSKSLETPRKAWSPSPLVIRLVSGSSPTLAEVPSSASSELFWNEVRNRLLENCDRLKGNPVRGVLVLHGSTSLPRRAMPAVIVSDVIAQLDRESLGLLQSARMKVEQDVVWRGSSDFGRYAFRLVYSPNAEAGLELVDPTKVEVLAPAPEPCDTGKKLQSAGQWQVADIRELLTQIVAQLPSAPNEKLKAIGELYSELQRQIAPQLAPAIAEILKGTHEMSYDEKAALAHEINAVLADSRLAIRDPKSKLPATLLAQRPKVTGPTSYLRISDTRKASDGKRHYFKVEDLSNPGVELELIDERDRPIETQRG